MTSSHLLLLTAFLSAALLATGCEPGKTSAWSPDAESLDSGVEDVFGEDAVDTPDVEDAEDAFTGPDAELPDATQPDSTEPDITEPDITEPDPPPSWDCSAVACSTVDDASTTLGSMRAVDGCAFELAFQHPISEGRALADRLLDRLEAESLGARRSL